MRGRAYRPHDRTVPRPVSALAAVLAASAVLVGAGPASADEPVAPGETRTVVIPVPDQWAADADVVRIAVRALEELENGCLEPEEEAGDDCGDGRGELADKMVATVAWGAGDGGCQAEVKAARLEFDSVDGVRFQDVAGVECVVLHLTFPHGKRDSVAQSDSLQFELDVVGEERPGTVGRDDLTPTPTLTPTPSGSRDRGPDAPSQDPGGRRPGSDPGAGARAGGGAADGASRAGGGTGRDAAAQGARGVIGAPGARAAGVEQRTPAGPMVGRVGAQVSVGSDGLSVETRAADVSLPGMALAWSSLLLGAIALGWVAFILWRRRRRRRTEVAA
jgi:hypothetical protein